MTGVLTGLMVVLSAVSLIGLVLFVIAMHRLSKYYSEATVFKNVLYGLLITIAAGAVAVAVEIGLIATTAYPSTVSSAAALAWVTKLMLGLLTVFIVAIISAIISAVFYWRAFTKLGEKSNVEAFKTAGLLYLIGTVLTIVAVGVIIVWIAWIYAAKGFRQLQPQPFPASSNNLQAPAPPSTGVIYCSFCGTQNNQNAVYCNHCGKPLHINQTSV